MKNRIKKHRIIPILCGLIVFIIALSLSTGMVAASPAAAGDSTGVSDDHSDAKDCAECHLDIAESWSHSPHAHAYDDPYFQEQWAALGQVGDCLSCHTTNYVTSTGEYSAEGVYCEACHGKIEGEHPPGIVSLEADTEYCGSCHTTTLSEWRSTGHAPADVGCMDCHNPHSQDALFEVADDMCINCHQEDMERYLEDLHVQMDIGCVDCHALVIPPEVAPDDGIVPTGHAFNITPGTCVACHTDALHAGFSLPGYENGSNGTSNVFHSETGKSETVVNEIHEAETLTPEQRIETLETALASRNITTLFQGGVIGIVLGSSTAWVVGRNIRRTESSEKQENENGEEK